MSDLKVSIVTVAYNSQKTIGLSIASVNMQSYENIEHIFIDGLSNDLTINIIKASSNRDNLLISEVDKGIYDAMNKGALISSGDILAFLNSDDFYVDSHVIQDVVDVFKNHDIDFVYGDVDIINNDGKILRSWHVGKACESRLNGAQIPHPSFFIRRRALSMLSPPFDSKYKIAADFKQQLILINQIRVQGRYLPRTLVKMKIGGASTNGFLAYYHGWTESISAYNEVFGSGGLLFVVRKVLVKFKAFSPIALFELLFKANP